MNAASATAAARHRLASSRRSGASNRPASSAAAKKSIECLLSRPSPTSAPMTSQSRRSPPSMRSTSTSAHPVQNSGSKTFMVTRCALARTEGESAVASAVKPHRETAAAERSREKDAQATSAAPARMDTSRTRRASRRQRHLHARDQGDERGLVDVAPGEPVAAGDEVQLVAEEAVAASEGR